MNHARGKRRKHRSSVRRRTLSINGKKYHIFNINEHGVGFLIDSPEDFEIGSEIGPMILDGGMPVRVTGIPRHISHFQPPNQPLGFQHAWVCGLEFTTRHDLGGWILFRQYMADIINRD